MATPDNKRKAAEDAGGSAGEGEDGQVAKRPKIGEPGAPQAKPAVNLAILEKAKKALEMQKGLKEKLERLKQAGAAAKAATAPAPTAAPTATRPATKLPPPLVVDEHGREVGATARTAEPSAPAAPRPNPLLAAMDEPPEEQDGAHFDPFLDGKAAKWGMERRARSSLRFVEEGRYQRQAQDVRLRQEYGDSYVRALEERRRREAEEEAAAGGMDPNLIPLGSRGPALPPPPGEEAPPPPPEVEWWDARLLVDKTKYPDTEILSTDPGSVVRSDRITLYVEHPVPLEPPAQAPPPPPQPLKLTKAELKKLRTQRRQAREQEKQELIRQGLLEPPPPKVKISNLMRVLGAEAAADPTAIEAEVRRQMAERVAAHEDRNLARMLTPAERREKKMKKLLDPRPGQDGADPTVQVAVYKVGDLSIPQLKFKVEVNAKENHLTGAAVCLPDAFCVVVVEGGPKTLRRYEKLMLRRINWATAGKDEEEEEEEGGEGERLPNYCHLVWTGIVKDKAFRGRFRTETVRTETAGRALLEEKGVGHYWDLAAAFVAE